MLLIATCGMMVLVSATDLVTVFLGIETMSIALYVLAGIRSERQRSGEAAIKYLLLGAFATGFLLYGMALLYGGTGGLHNLTEIGSAVSRMGGAVPVYVYAGAGLMMIGLLFKVAAVPFHFWSPDVYQGAPTPVTAFMSAGPKAAAFVAFIRVFAGALPDLSAAWGPALWVIAVVTMTTGNIIAIAQKDIKRMLAYSSIAHAGYLLVGVLAAAKFEVFKSAAAGVMFYLVAYYLMNIGAFTIAILVSRAREGGDYQIDDYKGMSASHPWLSAAMALFLISLAGIPPTAGFFGKLYVFSAAVNAGYVTLVVIAVLNSAISVYYYLRIVVFMYMQPAEKPISLKLRPALAVVIVICVLGILKFGLLPGYLMNWAGSSAEKIVAPTTQVASGVVENEATPVHLEGVASARP
jgi:NADH-quinone oxidoreductase subunit N